MIAGQANLWVKIDCDSCKAVEELLESKRIPFTSNVLEFDAEFVLLDVLKEYTG